MHGMNATTKGRGFYFGILFALLLLSVAANRYHHYIIREDFHLEANASCDPLQDRCFVSDCSVDDPECNPSPYKKVHVLARNAPKCLEEHTCENFQCAPGDATCAITYCDADNLEEWELCAIVPPADAEVLDIQTI